MPEVSIIMPAYNAERYIGEAIDSVLAQTLADWELIVVDDGSTDRTPVILRYIGDARVRILHQKNQGPASARNAGLEAANGTYVAFLDADDLYLPSALADLAEYLDTHPECDIVYSDGIMCDQDKRPLMTLSEHRPGSYTGRVLEQLVLSNSVIAVPICTLTRKTLLDAHRLRFDHELDSLEDSYFWVEAARYAYFGYLDRVTSIYRIHQTNISLTTDHKARAERELVAQSKILQSTYFPGLSLPTRVQFIYRLLTTTLDNQIERQLQVLESSRFLDLPVDQQAFLYRMAAVSYLLQRKQRKFAESCLERATVLQPRDHKSRVLLLLLRISTDLCFRNLQLWRAVSKAKKYVMTIGQRRPKPVPVALRRQ